MYITDAQVSEVGELIKAVEEQSDTAVAALQHVWETDDDIPDDDYVDEWSTYSPDPEQGGQMEDLSIASPMSEKAMDFSASVSVNWD